MMLFKSRNTMVTSAVLFLIVVILLRVTGGFLEENIVRVVGSIFAGNAENIPLIDFSSMNFAWLNPESWSLHGIAENINGWAHNMIDSVLPAFINTVNIATITAVLTRTKLLSVVVSATKFAPAAAI